ncbi:hypothetical protein EUGRSUZ_H03215 [Eucalyptus grandis]|uniref:Sialate O-acetylesterase domain-containing protein n=2 Tax=Eucalyptus grandis TaxID=71139 RepID=A0A059B2P6_EUCGR|nr:hypothetical protein EUGRSUZ_H03215 [Eucalyptus grandis]
MMYKVAITSGGGRYMDRVRHTQLGIKLSSVVCIDVKGLPFMDDHLHFATHAQVCLDHSRADAYLQYFVP